MKIDEIILSPDRQELLDNFLEHQNNPIYKHQVRYSPYGGRKRIQTIIGGTLCSCGTIPKYSVTFQLKGITKLERYCENCFNLINQREEESASILNSEQVLKLR